MLLKLGDPSLVAPEIEWFHDSLDVNYAVILDMRNEVAVAALALHEWQLYSYNNKIYTQLYKEMSADNTLADYCRRMQQSQTNKRIAVILLVILLLAILPAYYLLYYRHRLYNRFYYSHFRSFVKQFIGRFPGTLAPSPQKDQFIKKAVVLNGRPRVTERGRSRP